MHPINNIPPLAQKMAWCLPGDKPLYEPVMVSVMTPICVTRPEWVKGVVCKNIFSDCLICSVLSAHLEKPYVCYWVPRLFFRSPVTAAVRILGSVTLNDMGQNVSSNYNCTPAIVRKVNFILRRKHGQANAVVWVYITSSVIWLSEGNFSVMYPMCTHKMSVLL